MTNQDQLLTVTSLLTIATDLLESNGYTRVDDSKLLRLAPQGGRLFEDEFGIVAVVVFETWEELMEEWPEAQASVVEIMSEFVSIDDPKSWDGYLVLFTPSIATGHAAEDSERIRHDTSRLRKLVATGDELTTPADVNRALLPVLPLEPAQIGEPVGSALDLLPELLAKRAIPKPIADAVVEAFATHESLIDRIHAVRGANETS